MFPFMLLIQKSFFSSDRELCRTSLYFYGSIDINLDLGKMDLWDVEYLGCKDINV